MRRLVELPVQAADPDELLMRAALGNLAVVKHDDLVDLVESLKLVRDEQGGTARSQSEKVGGQGSASFRIKVRGRLVEDQHGRIREQRPGQREPLPFAAGHGRAVRADRGVPAAGQRLDPGQ